MPASAKFKDSAHAVQAPKKARPDAIGAGFLAGHQTPATPVKKIKDGSKPIDLLPSNQCAVPFRRGPQQPHWPALPKGAEYP